MLAGKAGHHLTHSRTRSLKSRHSRVLGGQAGGTLQHRTQVGGHFVLWQGSGRRDQRRIMSMVLLFVTVLVRSSVMDRYSGNTGTRRMMFIRQTADDDSIAGK